MPAMAPLVVSALLGLSALMWAMRLVLPGGSLSPQSAALLGLDILLLATVALTGLLVTHGRWAHRLGWAVVALEGVAAALTDPNVLWWSALAVSALSVVAWTGPWLQGWVRLLPAAAGPPSRAVLLALGLLLLPAVVALTNPGGPGWEGWLLAGGSLLLALLYTKAVTVALWVLRFGLVVLALPAVLAAPPLGEVALAAAVTALVVLAWTADVRLAVAPLIPTSPQPEPPNNPPLVLPRPRLRRRDPGGMG
jgi:hypothetical protein